MSSIFTKIVQGEIPCHKIAEDDRFLAFLDIAPLAAGHTLVIPKIEVDYIFDMEDNLLGDLMIFAKKVTKSIEAVIPCQRIAVSVIGIEVPHTHIHLLPFNSMKDIDFSRPKLQLAQSELAEIAAKIRQEV
ncbi:MAG: HIT family protein [Bacteroidota bacterium]